jgi:hypothetical protein
MMACTSLDAPYGMCQKCNGYFGECMRQSTCGRCPQCGMIGRSQCLTCTNYSCDTCTCSYCRGGMCVCHKKCHDKHMEKTTLQRNPFNLTVPVHDLTNHVEETNHDDSLASALNKISIQPKTQSLTPMSGVNMEEEYQGNTMYEYYDERSYF